MDLPQAWENATPIKSLDTEWENASPIEDIKKKTPTNKDFIAENLAGYGKNPEDLSAIEKIFRGISSSNLRMQEAIQGANDWLGNGIKPTQEEADNRKWLRQSLDDDKEKLSQAGITPKRKAELEALKQNASNAKGIVDNAKATVATLYDTVTHPSEWTAQGITEGLTSPENLVSLNPVTKGTTIGGKIFSSALTGAAENVAVGTPMDVLQAKGQGKSNEEIGNVAIQSAVGNVLAGAGIGGTVTGLKEGYSKFRGTPNETESPRVDTPRTGVMTPEESAIAQNLAKQFDEAKPIEESKPMQDEYTPQNQIGERRSMDGIKEMIRTHDRGGEEQAKLFETQMQSWADGENLRRKDQGLEPNVTAEDMANTFLMKYENKAKPTEAELKVLFDTVTDAGGNIKTMEQRNKSHGWQDVTSSDQYGQEYTRRMAGERGLDSEITTTSPVLKKLKDNGYDALTPDDRAMVDKDIDTIRNHPDFRDENQVLADNGELFQAKQLEDRYLKNDRVIESEIMKDADKLPEQISSYRDFKSNFTESYESKGTYFIDTPIGNVKVDPHYAFGHFIDNTHFDDRGYISGAFVDTLKDPLFVVEKKHKDTINQVFYKPFKSENGNFHLASFAVDKNGMVHKTFFELDNLGKLKGLIKVADKDLKYFKHSNLYGSTERSVSTTSKSAYDESISQLNKINQDVKGSYAIDQKLIKLFESHDVSTLNHELGHRFYYTLSPRERGALHEIFGVKDGEWKVEHHEAFADAYVRYIAEGKTTHTVLRAIFEKMKEFTKQILLSLKENNGGKLPPLSKEAREFFSAVMGDEKARNELMKKDESKDASSTYNGTPNELFQIPKNLLSPDQRPTIGDDVAKFKAGYTKVKETLGTAIDAFRDMTPDYYKELTSDRFTAIAKLSDKAELIHKSLIKLSPETNKILQQAIVGDIKSLPQGYQTLQPLVTAIRTELNAMSKKLVDSGMLDKETAEAYKDTYLKRSYEGHWAKKNGDIQSSNDVGVKQIIGRGKEIEAKNAEEVAQFVEDYLLANNKNLMPNMMDIADIKDYLTQKGLIGDSIVDGKIVWKEENGKVTLKRDWSKDERVAMKEIENASLTVPNTILSMGTMIHNAELMKDLSKYSKSFKDIDEAHAYGYEQIPNTKRYGMLAGKYVDKHIADQIKYTFEKQSELFELWTKSLSVWKQGKTVFNPTSHFNNFTSNILTQFMLGRDLREAGKMTATTAQMLKEFPTKIAKYEEMRTRDYIGMLNSKEKAEFASLKSDLKYYIEGKENGLFGRGQITDILKGFDAVKNSFGDKGAATRSIEAVQKLYQMGDDIPRLASYKVLRESGMSVKEAKEFVTALYPDYSKPLPKGVRFLKDWGLSPFISWSYFVLPNFAKLVKAHPERAVALMATIYGGFYLWSGINPFGDDIPDKEQGRRVPISSDGTTLKIDRMIPGSDFAAVPMDIIAKIARGVDRGDIWKGVNDAANATGRNIGKLAQNYLYGGVAQLAGDLVTNKDSYSGRTISGDTDSATKGAYNYLKHIAGFAAPAPLANIGGIIENEVNPKAKRKHSDVEPRTNIQEILKQLGLNTQTYNTNEVRRKRFLEDKKLLKESSRN